MFIRGKPAVLAIRPRGDTSKLPMELDISTTLRSALPKVVVGLVFAAVGYNALGLVTGGTGLGPLVAMAFQAAPYVFMLAGLFVFGRGLAQLGDRRTVRVADGTVTVTGKSLFGSENWSEPLSAFEGVRWREIVVHRRSRLSGHGSNNERRARVYQVLDLKHPNPDRCVPLYVTGMRQDRRRGAEGLQKALEKADDPRAHAVLGALAGNLGEEVRPKWEHFSKLLEVPAIDATGGDDQVRAAEDIDKSVKELAVEGKIEADWDDSAPAPAGLSMVQRGDSADPDSQEILVTVHARRFPVWLYGALMAVSGFILILGVSDLSLIAIMFGGGLGAGVYWHWNYENKNPPTVRISRTEVEFNTPNPGNPPTHGIIPHGDIEGVRITNRYDKSAIGPRVAVVTDRGAHEIGAGLSGDGQAWLRDLILSAVAKA
ncbi:MAG TPA: hypothetical protein VLA52_16125 [Thermohalobaculum sp.]|nr:hypothetical protein [Thermohalobaculum sp.]